MYLKDIFNFKKEYNGKLNQENQPEKEKLNQTTTTNKLDRVPKTEPTE